MILSNLLKEEATKLAANKFAFEILNRLRVVEAESAYYLCKKPLYKLYRPSSATSPSNTLLTKVDALADLIHDTYSLELKDKANNQLKKIINGIFPKTNEPSNAIKNHVDGCNIKILNLLNHTEHPDAQLPQIRDSLIKCFPKIDRAALSRILSEIAVLAKSANILCTVQSPTTSGQSVAVAEEQSVGIEKLKVAPLEPEEQPIEIEGDFIQIPNIPGNKNKFFAMNGGNAHSASEEKPLCILC